MPAVWRINKPTLPQRVTAYGLTVLEDSVVVCTAKSWYQARRLDLFRGGCTNLAPMLSYRAYGGVATLNGCVYAVGGCNDDAELMATVEFYDPQKNVWHSVAGLPLPLANFAMVATNDRLYVFGGTTKSGENLIALNSVFYYDPAVDAWNKLADMPTARRWCSACVGLNGVIYVIGGYSDGDNGRCVEAYETSNDRWLKKSDMISNRCGAGCAYVDGKIYVLGGFADDLRCDIEFYDESLDIWRPHPCRLSEPNRSLACTVMTMKKGANWTGQMDLTLVDQEGQK
ncbi:kelch-like protein 17 [Paramacrobiotus metropolitanus]|uniref:kelch-like protein 17 n=1 Tax=Paramacrobiotus metropolitanus TaxID=2943436 RepID=UPI0024460323|nr:kelch-like protein 17 [Paramacrobiotus metropolitanus]